MMPSWFNANVPHMQEWWNSMSPAQQQQVFNDPTKANGTFLSWQMGQAGTGLTGENSQVGSRMPSSSDMSLVASGQAAPQPTPQAQLTPQPATQPVPQQQGLAQFGGLMQQTGPPPGTTAAGATPQPSSNAMQQRGGQVKRKPTSPARSRPPQNARPTPVPQQRPAAPTFNSGSGAPVPRDAPNRQVPTATAGSSVFGPQPSPQASQQYPQPTQQTAPQQQYPQQQAPPQLNFGPNVQTSVQPQPVYNNQQMQASQNVAAANAVPAMNDLRQAGYRPGFSLNSGASQAGMGAALGQGQATGAYQPSAMVNQMGWQNAGNYLQGQQMRDQEAQGWAGLANQGLANQWQNRNQQAGQTFGLLGSMYGRM